MTYDVLMRRVVPTGSGIGEGVKHHFDYVHVEAASEEEAFSKVRRTTRDAIACIDGWHHAGLTPFSVDMGAPEFFTEARRPEHFTGSEQRVG